MPKKTKRSIPFQYRLPKPLPHTAAISTSTVPINTAPTSTAPARDQQSLYHCLHSLLEDLSGVEQSPRYHPEGDALYHSLQVFQCALAECSNPQLWAAALFHDVGKAIHYAAHAAKGADELEGLLHPSICWLVRHHLDLLTHPKRTRARLKGSKALQQLEQLRRWDLQGRKTDIEVMEVTQALDILLPYFPVIQANRQ